MSILIVEDNEIVAQVISWNLEKEGYQCATAVSGTDALMKLTFVPQISLIITDLVMPEMDGFELLAQLRATERWRNMPVIICTSIADSDFVVKARELNCHHYLLKPIQRELLIQTVAEAMKLANVDLREQVEVIRRYGLTPSTYRDLLEKFSEAIHRQLKAIDALSQSSASLPVKLDLSTLCESADIFGADRLLGVINRLQPALQQARLTMDDCLQLKTELERLCKIVDTTLKAGISGEITGRT